MYSINKIFFNLHPNTPDVSLVHPPPYQVDENIILRYSSTKGFLGPRSWKKVLAVATAAAQLVASSIFAFQ